MFHFELIFTYSVRFKTTFRGGREKATIGWLVCLLACLLALIHAYLMAQRFVTRLTFQHGTTLASLGGKKRNQQ